MSLFKRLKIGLVATLMLTMSTTFALGSHSFAQANPYTPPAKITFTFDDGLATTYKNAAPIMQKYGLAATDYLPTGCVGMTTQPNTCNANNYTTYMTWPQIQALQNTYGWEVASETVDHYCLASSAVEDPDDCQANYMTTAQVDAELSASKSALTSHGLNVTDFSPPFGDYNASVLAQIAKYYASMRQFRNSSNNTNAFPYSDYYLWDLPLQQTATPVSTIEAAINSAIANHTWLILTVHDVKLLPSKNPDDYEYGTAELAQLAAYVKAKQDAGLIQNTTIAKGLTQGTNLLPNSNFASGLAGGWSTDAPATITTDSGSNGSWPDPTNSIKLTSTSTTTHLFSPLVPVTPGAEYALKSYLNVASISSGLVGFYIDEYDSNGNWISGQWKAQENSNFAEDMNFAYVPSSASVAKARLQIVVSANPGITAYFDNAQWIPVYTPTHSNLMPNPNFATGLNGGWTTDDPTNITADSGGHGSPAAPQTAVKLVSSSANTHLFSPKIPVSSTNSYELSAYLNIVQMLSNNVVGFYIDEYNSSGNWISGQYKLSASTPGPNTYNLAYTPSSTSVASASLQVILEGNSSTTAYISDVQMFQL